MTTDMTVKFAAGSDTIIEGYGVPFGDDLDGQRFEADTDRCHNWFPKGGRPILADHGFNKKIKMTPVGVELSTTPDDIGDFVRAELDKSHKYYAAVAQLVRDGKYGWSSGAPDHKVKIAKDGKIELWPVVEYSLTTTPAKPNTVAFAMKSAQVMELLEDADVEIPESLRETEGIEQAHEGDSEPETLADHSERVLAGIKAWAERLDEKVDFRLMWKERDAALPPAEQSRKSGRVLSSVNLDALDEVIRLLTDVRKRASTPDEAEASKSSLELTLALTET